MNLDEIKQEIDRRRRELDIPADYAFDRADERFIEYTADILVPGPVSECRAWVLTYVKENRWREVSVDQASGQVVRVLRSRA